MVCLVLRSDQKQIKMTKCRWEMDSEMKENWGEATWRYRQFWCDVYLSVSSSSHVSLSEAILHACVCVSPPRKDYPRNDFHRSKVLTIRRQIPESQKFCGFDIHRSVSFFWSQNDEIRVKIQESSILRFSKRSFSIHFLVPAQEQIVVFLEEEDTAKFSNVR